jgi:hypothetical protein
LQLLLVDLGANLVVVALVAFFLVNHSIPLQDHIHGLRQLVYAQYLQLLLAVVGLAQIMAQAQAQVVG